MNAEQRALARVTLTFAAFYDRMHPATCVEVLDMAPRDFPELFRFEGPMADAARIYHDIIAPMLERRVAGLPAITDDARAEAERLAGEDSCNG